MSQGVFGTIRDTDIKDFLLKLKRVGGLEKVLEDRLQQMAIQVHSEAVKSIQKRSKGSVEGIRYSPRRKVNVSPPGEPPNTDTGRLVQSIGIEVDSDKVVVGTNLKYGAWLEFGTREMKARPWLRPAFRKILKKFKFNLDVGDVVK